MNNYVNLMEDPEDYIPYYSRNTPKYILYLLLFVAVSHFIISCIFFFNYMPNEISTLKTNLNAMSSGLTVLSGYEKKLDLMKNESTQIYDIIMNLCKNPAISSYCK